LHANRCLSHRQSEAGGVARLRPRGCGEPLGSLSRVAAVELAERLKGNLNRAAGGIEHAGAVAAHGAEHADNGIVAALVDPPAGGLLRTAISGLKRIGRSGGFLGRR